jgi:hypothetical protein
MFLVRFRPGARSGAAVIARDGRQPRGLSANRMLQNVPEAWDEQRKLWEFTA